MNLYVVFGEELSNPEALKLYSICTQLAIPYYSEYVKGTARRKQNVAIARGMNPAPVASAEPAPVAPAEPAPVASAEPAPVAPAEPAPVAPASSNAELLNAIKGLETTIKGLAVATTSQPVPKSETVDDIIASIINPQ